MHIALTLLLAISVAAPIDDAERIARCDAIVVPLGSDDAPGCAVGVMRDGELVYARGVGLANLEHRVPITPRTVFHVASVSKQFTAHAAALLAAEGRLDLDADVRGVLPELPDFGATITAKHLVYHAAGLRDQWDLLVLAGWRMEDVITRDDVLELMAAQRALNFPPGSGYLYCNTGYTLLALMVERIAGQPFDAYCTERLFAPLGMEHSLFLADHHRIVPDRAESYRRAGAGWQRAPLAYSVAGATSLHTTIEDLARWETGLAAQAIGGAETAAILEEQLVLPNGVVHPYGFGLFHGIRHGRPMQNHAGGDAGFRSFLLRFPEERLSVAVLANAPMDTGRVAYALADAWLEEDPGESSAVAADGASEVTSAAPTDAAPTEEAPPVDAALRGALVGRYVVEQPPLVVGVAADDDRLVLVVPGDQRLELRHRPEESSATAAIFTVPALGAEGRAVFTLHEGVAVLLEAQRGETTIYRLERFEPPADAALAEYVGAYRSAELDVQWRLERTEEGLVLRRRKHGRAVLPAIGPDRFGGDPRIRFVRDEAGRVVAFLASTDRVIDLRFDRVADDDSRLPPPPGEAPGDAEAEAAQDPRGGG